MSEDLETRREHYLKRWTSICDEKIKSREESMHRWSAFANFILQRNHSHEWTCVAEVVTVEGLGTRLQFSRWCYCGRRQYLIEWWNQFEEPCYHG